MSLVTKIKWEDLPHDKQIGHGREGLILRINESHCIKIYSPDRTNVASTEYKNYGTLLDSGFSVSKPEELVEVIINKQPVKLPSKCEIMGIGLYTFNDVDNVPAIIKEFIPGVPYGQKKPSIWRIKKLLKYLFRLHKKGFAFSDGVIEDFIDSVRGPVLVDCSTLLERDNYEEICRFEVDSTFYSRRIIRDLEYGENSCPIRLAIAKLLVPEFSKTLL